MEKPFLNLLPEDWALEFRAISRLMKMEMFTLIQEVYRLLQQPFKTSWLIVVQRI